MGWCIDFKLIEVEGILAKYQYGQCLHELDGVLEVNVVSVINGELPGDTPMSEVARVIVPCSGEGESRYLAIKAFTAIHRYYKQNGAYPEKGGYYA